MRLQHLLLVLMLLMPNPTNSAEKIPEIQFSTEKTEYTCRNVKLLPGYVILGCYDGNSDEIFIREDLNEGQKQKTINHEIAHHLTRNYTKEDYEKIFHNGRSSLDNSERIARIYADYRQGEITQAYLGPNLWHAIRKMEKLRQRQEKY